MAKNKRHVPVTTHTVHLICDCGGEMLPTGIMLTSIPPHYPHRCKICGTVTDEPTEAFPHIEYVEQEE